MHLSRIVYNRRFNLGDYQHEDITVEYAFDPEEQSSVERALLDVRDKVSRNNTLYLKAQAEKNKETK